MLALFAAWLWQPERQVRLHQKHFLQAVERRNWRKVESFLSPDYLDQWGFNAHRLGPSMEEGFSQFLFLSIEQRLEECAVHGDSGSTKVTVRVKGSGGPMAQQAMSAVNALRKPFTFTWRRESGSLSDWRLERVENEELTLHGLLSL